MKNYLYDFAEDMLIKRRNRLREKRVLQLKKRSNTKIPMRLRDHYIEPRIENDLGYFGARNQHKVQYIDLLRKELRKNDDIMNKR